MRAGELNRKSAYLPEFAAQLQRKQRREEEGRKEKGLHGVRLRFNRLQARMQNADEKLSSRTRRPPLFTASMAVIDDGTSACEKGKKITAKWDQPRTTHGLLRMPKCQPSNLNPLIAVAMRGRSNPATKPFRMFRPNKPNPVRPKKKKGWRTLPWLPPFRWNYRFRSG